MWVGEEENDRDRQLREVQNLLPTYLAAEAFDQPEDEAGDGGENGQQGGQDHAHVVHSHFLVLHKAERVDEAVSVERDLCDPARKVLDFDDALDHRAPAEVNAGENLQNLEVVEEYFDVDGGDWARNDVFVIIVQISDVQLDCRDDQGEEE